MIIYTLSYIFIPQKFKTCKEIAKITTYDIKLKPYGAVFDT